MKNKVSKRQTHVYSKSKSLQVIPLGGCGEFGMNMTCYLTDKKFIVVDVGSIFPEPKQLGVSSIIPSVKKTYNSFGTLLAYFITHGHEDHIGAIYYVYQECPAPIYATPWTAELIKRKFKANNQTIKTIHVVNPGQKIRCAPFFIEYVHVNHSIPDASSLFIKTEKGNVFHTGDFKVDKEPPLKKHLDLKQFERIRKEGVDLLLTDSTNANRPGFSPSESSIFSPMEQIMRSAKKRILITGFSSNLWRINTIVKLCKKLGKKLLVDGRGLRNCLEMGQQFGYMEDLTKILVEEKGFRTVKDDHLVIILSGSQGERRSSLVRAARKEHRFLSIKENDLVIFSARPIPGNDRDIIHLSDLLKEQGAEVVTPSAYPDIHVSGHACVEDLSYFIKKLEPKCYVPVHGTYSFLADNQTIVENFPKDKIQSILIKNGEIIDVCHKGIKKLKYQINLERRFVDQESSIPIGYKTLQERLDIGELGLIVVAGVFGKRNKKWIKGPQIKLVGIELSKGVDRNKFLKVMSEKVKTKLNHVTQSSELTQETLRKECCLQVGRLLRDPLRKKVTVLGQLFLI